MSVTLATTFGVMNIEVTEMRDLNLAQDISVTEEVPVILNKSLSRTLALSAVTDVGHERDQLKGKFDALVNSLQLKSDIQSKYFHLFESPFERNDDRRDVIEAIFERVQERATITYMTAQWRAHIKEYKKIKFDKIHSNSKHLQEKVGGMMRRLWNYFSWLILSGSEIEDNYTKQLEAVIAELSNGEKHFIYAKDEKQKTLDERSDLWDKFKDVKGTEQAGATAYLLEKIFVSYWRDLEILKVTELNCRDLWSHMFICLHKEYKSRSKEWSDILKKTFISADEFFMAIEQDIDVRFNKYDTMTKDLLFTEHKKLLETVNDHIHQPHEYVKKKSLAEKSPFKDLPRTNQVVGHLAPHSKEVVLYKSSHFKMIHEIREIYGRQCYIGFIGPQNAGKSTLLNSLWRDRLHQAAQVGYDTHTQRPTKYNIAEDIFAVDFPGSNSLKDDVLAGFERFGHMNNMFIYIMEYNGEPDKTLVTNVGTAYRIMSCSGKFSKIIFCLNKAHWKMPNKMFDENYKLEYVQQISDYLQNNREERWWEKAQLSKKQREEMKAEEEKHKKYMQENMKSEDFLFTDWVYDASAASHGVKGPEDVRLRIKDFLVDHVKIRKPNDTEDINLGGHVSARKRINETQL